MKIKIFILILFAILSYVSAFKISGRIAHGHNAALLSAPYMLSFQILSEGEFNHICGGSIINEYWALTAAHCFNFSNDTTQWEIKAGRHNIESISEPTQQTRKIVYLKVHEGYGGGAEPTDIAIVRVNEPFIFNGAVNRIRLAIPGETLTGDGILFGWGLLSTKPVKTSTILQTGVIPIISNKKCSEFFEKLGGGYNDIQVTEANVCAVDKNGISACASDSGGPFVKLNTEPNVVEQIGIVAWGSECGQANYKSVTVFTKIAHYIDWIEKVQHEYKEKTGKISGEFRD